MINSFFVLSEGPSYKIALLDFTATKSGVWHVVVEKGSYHKPENIKASFSLEKVADAEHKPPKKLASTLQEADELVDHDTANEGEQEGVEKEQ